MSSHKNAYKRGLYHEAFEFMAKKQIVTRSQVVEFFVSKGKELPAANASATVLLSPRKENSKKGDCRGNFSAMGHLYFMTPLKKEKGVERKFRLFYRATPLDRRVYVREPKKVVAQVKETKATKATKVKGKVVVTD